MYLLVIKRCQVQPEKHFQSFSKITNRVPNDNKFIASTKIWFATVRVTLHNIRLYGMKFPVAIRQLNVIDN